MKKITLYLLLLILTIQVGYSQTEGDSLNYKISDIGLFPKYQDPTLYNFKVNGFYRFFGTYTQMKDQYLLNQAASDYSKKRSVFIGDDSQMPNLMLNFSGRPSTNSSWGFDLYTFQFLDGNIGQAYSQHVADSLRPSVSKPKDAGRLAGNIGIHLGINFYGNFKTNFGSIGIKAGGIHWTSLSDLTLASFKGYNRFTLFEPNPWDPMGNSVSKRYTDFYDDGNIKQDERWGEKAFVGLILEGANMPGKTSFKALFGKTELNGGFLSIPNFSYGGQIKKEIGEGFIGINTFNSTTYQDSLHTKEVGFNLATFEAKMLIAKFLVHLETGMGRYFAPSYSGNWGEALQLKLRTPENKKFNLELHLFRLSPEIINNSAVFWNTSIVEENNTSPAGTVGSSAVLQPFASSMVPLGMMTNNRQGYNLNFEIPSKKFKISAALGSSAEINAISNQITYGHPVNQLTRSRFWRWSFPTNVGPYDRYSVTFRDVYETVNLNDDSLGVVVNRKYFSGAEIQSKTDINLLNKKIYFFTISKISTVQDFWSPVPVFSEKAYIRQYSNEIEAYWFLSKKFVFNGYAGYERTIGNYQTEIDDITNRPRNQFGQGYGIGMDYSLGKNAVLMIRHRWFSFEDKNFELDKFNGTETMLEIKMTF